MPEYKKKKNYLNISGLLILVAPDTYHRYIFHDAIKELKPTSCNIFFLVVK